MGRRVGNMQRPLISSKSPQVGSSPEGPLRIWGSHNLAFPQWGQAETSERSPEKFKNKMKEKALSLEAVKNSKPNDSLKLSY